MTPATNIVLIVIIVLVVAALAFYGLRWLVKTEIKRHFPEADPEAAVESTAPEVSEASEPEVPQRIQIVHI
ncbi:hypothetical protein V8F33_004310 [Rhypophila sp. PSN 637]